MRIKRIKTRSQRITSSGYLKKFIIKEPLPVLVISKNLTELPSFTKTRKRGARQVFGRLFYFYNLGSGFQDLDRQTTQLIYMINIMNIFCIYQQGLKTCQVKGVVQFCTP
jgi:hypothetical protein